MELSGIEPEVFDLQNRRLPNQAVAPTKDSLFSPGHDSLLDLENSFNRIQLPSIVHKNKLLLDVKQNNLVKHFATIVSYSASELLSVINSFTHVIPIWWRIRESNPEFFTASEKLSRLTNSPKLPILFSNCGACRTRTDRLKLAKLALSQMS